jgi:hypothetical protein
VVTKLDSDLPESTQITFILSSAKLVTNRYVDPLPFRRFVATPSAIRILQFATGRAGRVGRSHRQPSRDVIERVATDLDGASVEVFSARGASAAQCAISARCSSVWGKTANSSPRRARVS